MKLGIIITTYNRPHYLRQCLESFFTADIPDDAEILIVDDASTDTETIKLVSDMRESVIYKSRNKSVKHSLLIGCDFLFNSLECDAIINIDADAIMKKNFIDVLLKLKQRFPEHLITGFNCLTKNRDGSVRHKVLMEGDGYNLKQSVGGINMLFDKQQYDIWIRPALLECLATQGNWDHRACIRSMHTGKEIVCAVPSVIQHIGIGESAMRHSLTEPPDVADDFDQKFQLKNVTLVGADCVQLGRLMRAADYACREIEFGAVKLFSSVATNDPRVIKIRPLVSKADYSTFIMKELGKYIETDFVLVVQHDGFPLNPSAWRNEWFNYDYIGAPWEWYLDGKNVGNGGFSLRSRHLQDILMNDPAIIPINEHGVTKNKEEDHCTCRIYRDYLESHYSIKFAPVEEARKFSIEGWNTKNPTWTNEFGFHGRSVDISKSNVVL